MSRKENTKKQSNPSSPTASIRELATLSMSFFSCKDISAVGALFVSEILKYIPAREFILDVNTYDFSRPPLFAWNLKPEWTRRYNKEFHVLNPSISTLKRLADDGLPVVKKFEDLCREPLEETAFYHEYMKPQKHRYSLIACQALQNLGGVAPNFQILLIRYESDPPYSESEMSLLQLMLPCLVQTTQRIMKDSNAWTASVLQNAFQLPPKLTEVAVLIVNGFSNKEIAEQLQITIGTAKHYAHQIFDLTGTATRADLCRVVLG